MLLTQTETSAARGLTDLFCNPRYGLGLFPPEQLDELMADFAVMGVRVMFQIVGEVSTLLSNNNTNAWGNFTQMVARVQQSPAHLGWCVPATSAALHVPRG